MEKIINKYPYILLDFSDLIKFNYKGVFSFFKDKITSFESEYYFLINPNTSFLFPNNKIGVSNKIIDEVINIAFTIKSNHSSIIKFFTYKKYIKEVAEIGENDDNKLDKEKLFNLLIKEIGNEDTPKSDIITSLSDLYAKMEKSLISGKNKKKKILKIILVNNEMERYKNINEKLFEDEKLQNILNEFVHDKSYFFGVELKYIDDRLMEKERKGFEKISDFITGQVQEEEEDSKDDFKEEEKEDNQKLIKSIYQSDEYLRKAEKTSLSLYNKWNDIKSNETLKGGIEKLDEVLQFYIGTMNSIITMKNKIKAKSRDISYKEKCILKINNYITSTNLNNKKNDIISSETYQLFIQDINSQKKSIEEITFDTFIKKLKENKGYNNCICWAKIVSELINQKKYIVQYLDILLNSSTFIDLFEKEIIKKAKEIISPDKQDNENKIEKNENDKDEDDVEDEDEDFL